jgi:2-oxoisovalerate dehydrogenase E2 component (dihydrolipoyl transacylase)
MALSASCALKMAIYEFKLPDLAEGTTEGEIAAWYVSVGGSIAEEQPLVGIMTDKAIIDIPSPVTGTVTSLHGAVGDKVPVGSVLAVFETDEPALEAIDAPVLNAIDSTASSTPTARAPLPGSSVAAGESSDRASGSAARPAASPSVRRRAREAGVSVAEIRGSGPTGRVLHADLDAVLSAAVVTPSTAAIAHDATSSAGAAAQPASPIEEIRIHGMRRKIAERMAQSKRTIPHFSYVEEIDVTELEALRVYLNSEHRQQNLKLTPLPFLMRALARVLPAYPDINAIFDSESGILRRHAGIHTGIATQMPSGLLVPVVRHVEMRDLWQCAAELGRVTAAARAGTATREELSGSTITLTSLGRLGGVAATPIINFPEVAILGPNRIIERPVVRAGQIVIRKMLNLSASFDHRLIDGYVAAEFIQRIKRLLELPATLFLAEPSP